MKFDEINSNIRAISDKILELVSSGNYDESLNLLNRYNEYFKNDVEILSAKSIALVAQNNYEAAEVVLKKALSIDKSNIDVLYNFAVLKQYTGDIKAARDFYMEILSITSDKVLRNEINDILKNIKDNTGGDNFKSFTTGKDNAFSNCPVIIKELPKRQQLPDVDDTIIARKNANECLYENRPLVSVCVLAYNNLEKYTKPCIESILKYTTDVDYELVLIDNGSSDGTFEYFKSTPHHQKRIFMVNENNGAVIGGNIGLKESASRYLVFLPNDVIVTKNWLSNMLRCAESDDRIGMVASASDSVSNLQSVNLGYSNLEDMQKRAEAYNISDPRKWEERIRLITVATLFKKDCLDVVGLIDSAFYHDFFDDDIAFRVRRAGYKAIFCGDTFIHHAGTTVNSEQYNKSAILNKGRNIFKQKYFGIDAWEDVNNYELNLISMIDLKEKRSKTKPLILGIDVKCGTPILQLKNKLRHANIFEAELSAFAGDAKYYIDLKTISSGDVIVDRPEYFGEYFKDKSFDYILMGMPLNSYSEYHHFLKNILRILKKDGHLLLKLINITDATSLVEILGHRANFERLLKSHVTLDILRDILSKDGFKFNKIINELYDIDTNTRDMLTNMVVSTPLAANKEAVISNLFTRYHLIDIVKG